jgi:anti-sigma factor RsiW
MIKCRELTELLTDYFDGSLSPWKSFNIKLHLMLCPNCRVHVAKMREMVDSMGYIPDETDVPDDVMEKLLELV